MKCEGRNHAPDLPPESTFDLHDNTAPPGQPGSTVHLCGDCVVLFCAAVLSEGVDEAVHPLRFRPRMAGRPEPLDDWAKEELARIWLMVEAALYFASSKPMGTRLLIAGGLGRVVRLE